MVKSMTGFGRSEAIVNGITVSVELKSVNHKFFEMNARMPRAYAFIEEKLKGLLKEYITRGKIDVFVNIDTGDMVATTIKINHSFAKAYLDAVEELSVTYGIKNDITAVALMRNADIYTVEKQEIEEDEIWQSVMPVVENAVKSFVEMREIEGKKLVADVNSRLDFILEKVTYVEQRSPETVKLYREKLEQKVRDLLQDSNVDEQRLLTETAIFADKIAVAEETVRLRSHISQLKNLLNSDDAIGRKSDFIVQEMNREANTIGSKAQDVEIAKCVVDIKAEIEKIREQIQNIE